MQAQNLKALRLYESSINPVSRLDLLPHARLFGEVGMQALNLSQERAR